MSFKITNKHCQIQSVGFLITIQIEYRILPKAPISLPSSFWGRNR